MAYVVMATPAHIRIRWHGRPPRAIQFRVRSPQKKKNWARADRGRPSDWWAGEVKRTPAATSKADFLPVWTLWLWPM